MLCGICFHILHSLTSSRNGTTNRCRWSPVTPYVCAINACWTRGLTRGLSGTSLHRVSVQDLSQWQKYIIYCNNKIHDSRYNQSSMWSSVEMIEHTCTWNSSQTDVTCYSIDQHITTDLSISIPILSAAHHKYCYHCHLQAPKSFPPPI